MRARLSCVVLAAICVLFPFRAGAQTSPLVCDLLGPAAQFPLIATRVLQAKSAPGYGNYYVAYPVFDFGTCASEIRAGRHGKWVDMIASRPDRTAISFGVVVGRRPGYGPYLGCYDYTYPCNAHIVDGDIVTGGGRVLAFNGLLPTFFDGTLDTTGTHPLVGQCGSAIARLEVLSAALAQGLLPGEPPEAARPIIDLGDVSVAAEDEQVLTPTGPGVTVYRVRNLTLKNGNANFGNFTQGGSLIVDGSDDELIVVNVTGRLRLGRVATLSHAFASAVHGGIVNVVGPGGSIKLDKFAHAEIPILAPQRKVTMSARGGAPAERFFYGEAQALLAADVILTGSAAVGFDGHRGETFCGLAD